MSADAAGDGATDWHPVSLRLEHLTWPEVGEALEHGWTTVVAAFGATEQHGPHLPLLVDAEHGTHLSEAIARHLGKALAAPAVRVGCSDHHLAFPGSLSLRRPTLEAIVHDYCTSLAHHGFRKICLVPTHGGNFGVLGGVVDALDRELGPACAVRAFHDLEGFMAMWTAAVQEEAGLGERVGGHADVAETALMMAMRPELVRADLAEEGFTGTVDEELLERGFREGFDTISPNGILGDARGASPGLGKRILEREAAFLADYFTD